MRMPALLCTGMLATCLATTSAAPPHDQADEAKQKLADLKKRLPAVVETWGKE
jgi:hypothetical protein